MVLLCSLAACGSSSSSDAKSENALAPSGTGGNVAGNGTSGASGAPPDDIATPNRLASPDGIAAVSVTLGESEFSFETPDLKHTFAATVSGDAANQVTWSSSDSYVASVDAQGVVTSVSGGHAVITATSALDPTKTAIAGVTIAEPHRARATSYVDAKPSRPARCRSSRPEIR